MALQTVFSRLKVFSHWTIRTDYRTCVEKYRLERDFIERLSLDLRYLLPPSKICCECVRPASDFLLLFFSFFSTVRYYSSLFDGFLFPLSYLTLRLLLKANKDTHYHFLACPRKLHRFKRYLSRAKWMELLTTLFTGF